MSAMAVPSSTLGTSSLFRPTLGTSSSCPARRRLVVAAEAKPSVTVRFSRAQSFRVRCQGDTRNHEVVESEEDSVDSQDVISSESSGSGSSLLAKFAIALGVAVTLTLICASAKRPVLGSSLGFQILPESSVSSSSMAANPVGFSFGAFGYRVVLSEHAPGWIYFWLLMAAGFGLFISEEALNIWVGISIARMLSLDGTWPSLAQSFSKNAGYIISTVFWVYWGVCLSDMIPFYLGKLFRQSGASDDVCSKLGIGEERALSLTRIVQKYGNLIGFIERFSLGVRNPTGFLAGALGISPEFYFAGVCCGCLITLPIQLGIGFLMRERPLFALATVATFVGVWTIFPYALAASTALFLYLKRQYSGSSL